MAKNTHLEHLEDSILLDGQQGAKDAFTFLDLLARTFSGKGSSNFKITTKWDGAPAIFCGIHPDTGKFFVGTKSVFNKDSKVNYSNDDIVANHGHAPGLVKKLKVALKYLPSLGIKGVAQGDILFTDDKSMRTIDGDRSLTFKPNTILYSIPRNSDEFDKANRAKIGVVFHTQYKEGVGWPSLASMSATFGFDTSKLKANRDVWVISAEMDNLGADTMLTEQEKQALIRLKSTSSTLMSGVGGVLNIIRDQIESGDKLSLGTKLKQYFNTYVRAGKKVSHGFMGDFEKYFETELRKEVSKVKTSKAKASKLTKLYQGQKILEDNQSSFKKVVVLYKSIQDAKEIFIKKLQAGQKYGTYLVTDDGIEVTNPEGYVAISNGTKAFKLVDRLEFSQANFRKDTIAKKWVSGS